MDESSLSEHEQRILQEIERNLAADDPDIERRLRDSDPDRSRRLLRLSLLGLVAGLAMLLAFYVHLAIGIAGFLLMLASLVAMATAVRELSKGGRDASGVFRKAWRTAEHRMRSRRKDS